MFSPTFGIIMQKHRFLNEEFEKIDEYAMTDGNGYIEFLDQNFNIIYPLNSMTQYTKNDINNMLNIYCIDQKIEKYRYIKDGKTYTEIISWASDDANGWFLKLDENFNYIDSANFYFIKDKYTEQDIEYILSDYVRDARVYKYEFTSNYGNKFTMVMTIDKKIQLFEQYEVIILSSVVLFLLILYILYISLSIRATSKKFKKPLNDLTKAINDFSNGKYILIDKTYQISEFNTIINTFNGMVKTLHELELKNKSLADQKRSILANISHDLKTPITIIQGYADVLTSKELSHDRQQEYIDKIYSKTQLLTKLINEFANYNKLNHPDFKLNLKSQNLCDVVRNYIANNYNYIIDNSFEIIADIPEDNFICSIDKMNFDRCLENIISNFIKYNEKGTTIHVYIKKHSKHYELVLENNGTPIDKDIVKNLFELLIMGDKSRQSDSSGLGLSVTRKIIELHGGTISYTNNKKYVNSFVINLPM